jgi:hypothetical protein
MMRWTGCVAFIGEMANEYKVVVRETERKERGWNHNINIIHKEIEAGIAQSI